MLPDNLTRSFSESELEGSFTRNGSISMSSIRKRNGSTSYKSSIKEVNCITFFLLRHIKNTHFPCILLFFQNKDEKPVVVTEESHFSGSVPLAVYWKYFKAGGGYFSFFLFILSCVITQFLFAGSDYWLSLWTDAEQLRFDRKKSDSKSAPLFEYRTANLTNSTSPRENVDQQVKWLDKIDTYTGIYVFTIFTATLFVFSLIRSIHFFVMCTNASIALHNEMFKAVIRAPLRFFEQNDVGNFTFLIQHLLIFFITTFLSKRNFFRMDIESFHQRYRVSGCNSSN